MEMHSSRLNLGLAKRLLNAIKDRLLVVRRELHLNSKRKLILTLNHNISLLTKRGNLLRKSLGNLMILPLSMTKAAASGGYGIQEYEFSCSDSPDPVFSRLAKPRRHLFHIYFPCINLPKSKVIQLGHDYQYESENFSPAGRIALQRSPLLSPLFSAAADMSSYPSNYNNKSDNISEVVLVEEKEEDDDDDMHRGGQFVDDEAEEFIKRFYEQLREQNRTQYLSM